MEKKQQAMIRELVVRIEEALGWGSGENWSNKDFEALSEKILSTTKKRLSVTTLKRIWGRAELVANPSMATLDILAEFLGYANWRAFTRAHTAQVIPVKLRLSKKRQYQLFLIVLALGVALGIRYLRAPAMANQEEPPLAVEEFEFKGNVVSTGMPNSVVFEYDAKAAAPDARLEIQQDWDSRKRIAVNRQDSVATCIYYRPGYFKSKLVVDGTIVKEDDVFISTEDWLGTLNYDSIPIYLTPQEIKQGTAMGTNLTTLNDYKFDPKVQEVSSSLYYIKDFKDLNTASFSARIAVKNSVDQALGGCQEIEVYILYDGGAIGIPLAQKGCISNLNLLAFDKNIDGKKNDLSAFGVSFDEYVVLECTSKNGLFQVFVNGALAYEQDGHTTNKAIKGISAHFQGAGMLGEVSFLNASGQRYQLN